MSTKTGTISHGTMRPEDLIPAFLNALDDVVEASTFLPDADLRVANVASIHDTAGAIERRMEQEDYFTSEDAGYDLEWLFDTLNAYAPDGHYFGAHPGDGSDYGFWEVEDYDGEVYASGPTPAWRYTPDSDHALNSGSHSTTWINVDGPRLGSMRIEHDASCTISESDRRARLIAAAPDLRDNQHPQLLDDCAAAIADDWPEYAEALTRKAMQERAAIAKAEGK